MRRRCGGWPAAVAAGAMLCAQGAARADDAYFSPTNDRLRLSLGLERASATTTLRIDSMTGAPGSVIDGENQLGLDKSRIDPKFQVMLRAGKRHRIRLDYFSLDRSNTQTLTGAPLAFRGAILLTGDPVQTDSNFRVLGLTYGYSFLHDEKYELAATLGLNSVDVTARVRVATPMRHVDASETAAGPLPTVGLDASWVLSHRFYLDGKVQYFHASIDRLTGTFGWYEFDALYRLRPNISFALGYNAVTANLTSQKTGDSGQYKFTTQGPVFFVRVAF